MAAEVSTKTLMNIDTTTLDWTIKDFDKRYRECNVEHEIVRRNFISGDGKFYFQKQIDDYVSLHAKLSNTRYGGRTKAQVSFSIAMESKEGDLIMIRKMQKPMDLLPYGKVYTWPQFMKIDELRQTYLRDDGILKMRLTVGLFNGTPADLQLISNNQLCNENEFLNRDFAQDFGDLLLSGEFSDVIFSFSYHQEDRDIEIKAHKMLLSARSPVFSAMFKTVMTEGITGKVVIDDIRAKTFKMMLEALYTGKLNEDWGSMADELIYAINKYELSALKNLMERKIMDVITVNNAIKIRKMAKLCNFLKTEKAIDIYIKDHVTEFMDMLGD